MKKYSITPLTNSINKKIEIPGSKSITNRALLLAALADGNSEISNALLSDDTKYMLEGLKKCGIKIRKKGKNKYLITGNKGKFNILKSKTFFLGNVGTATKFLTAPLSFCANKKIRVTGDKRMQERPIQDLIDGLNQLGAKVYSEKNNQCPPIIIEKQAVGGKCVIPGDKSSQYFSALLFAAPLAKKDIIIEVKGDLVSKSYIDLSLDIIKTFGVKIQNKNYKQFIIKAGQKYKTKNYKVEADASSATYFAAIAAATKSKIHITNLNPSSKQGDMEFLEILKKMGVSIKKYKNKGVEISGKSKLKPLGKINLNNMPDGAMTVAILCALTKGKSQLTGLQNLRLKETDRLRALSYELQKTGCDCQETKDGLIINGNPEKLHGAEIKTYDDHRMAMCFAVLGTAIAGITIINPDCVKKTYPDFWTDLKKLLKIH